MLTRQSWKDFYTHTRHQSAKMTLVGSNIFPNGFLHEKVSLNFKYGINYYYKTTL